MVRVRCVAVCERLKRGVIGMLLVCFGVRYCYVFCIIVLCGAVLFVSLM